MSKQGIVFENKNSKRRVTVQLRGYDRYGEFIPGIDIKTPLSLQVKNAEIEEVCTVIHRALIDAFGQGIMSEDLGEEQQ